MFIFLKTLIFQGAPHLCESYATSSLHPIGNDVQVNLRELHPSLTETPLPPPPPPPTSANYNTSMFFHESTSAVSGATSARKFQSASNNAPGHRTTPPSSSNSPSLTPKNRKRTQPSEMASPSPTKISKIQPPGMKMEVSVDQKPSLEGISDTGDGRSGKDSPNMASFDDVNPASPCGSNDSDIILDDDVLEDDPSTSMKLSAVDNAGVSMIGQDQNFGEEVSYRLSC